MYALRHIHWCGPDAPFSRETQSPDGETLHLCVTPTSAAGYSRLRVYRYRLATGYTNLLRDVLIEPTFEPDIVFQKDRRLRLDYIDPRSGPQSREIGY